MQVCVDVSDAEYAQLIAIAAERGISVEHLLAAALNAYVDRHRLSAETVSVGEPKNSESSAREHRS